VRSRAKIACASRVACIVALLAVGAAARASGGAPPAAPPEQVQDDEDQTAEPDFAVIVLPTNQRLPRHKLAFWMTHRFGRPLGEGSFGDLAADFFGLDGGAQIGLGLRLGVLSGTRLAVSRTSDRTIAFQAQQQLLRQATAHLGLSLTASVEGLDNLGKEYSPALGLVLSRTFGSRAAFYLVPSWVGNTRVVGSALAGDDSTLVLGLGLRLRVTRTLALVGEVHPRLVGYRGDLGSGDADALASFGIEGIVGGHVFQLNFSNGLGTTPAQVARGAATPRGWFLGFNLTRMFF
jgi:hypothetical protein